MKISKYAEMYAPMAHRYLLVLRENAFYQKRKWLEYVLKSYWIHLKTIPASHKKDGVSKHLSEREGNNF